MAEYTEHLCRTIFHVDLDAFFVTVEQVLNPSLAGKPVIVGGRPGSRSVVASASYEARAFGVHAAMPLMRVRVICPEAVFLTGHYSKYREYSDVFMSILSDYSPVIESGGLDEAYLDVTGCENFGSWQALAVKIKQRVRQESGLIASVGLAPCKVVAKVASDLSKPDGLIEILSGQERRFLSPLAVSKLPGVGKKTAAILRSLGIVTIGQLADMPDRLFLDHFGEGMLWLQQHAQGIDDSLVEARGEAKSISRETTFEKDTSDINLLTATLRYFAEKLGAELRDNEKQARTVGLKLRYEDFETVNRQSSSRLPTDLDDDIFQIGMHLLEAALGRKNRPIRLIGLEVSNLVAGERQLSMFNAENKKKEKVDRAVDLIRNKYGFDAIQTGYAIKLRRNRSDTKEK